MTQEDLENKLIFLAESQPQVDKTWMLIDDERDTIYANALLKANGMFPSQPLKEAHAILVVKESPVWERYQLAKYEKDTLDYQTKVYMKVASLRQSGSYK